MSYRSCLFAISEILRGSWLLLVLLACGVDVDVTEVCGEFLRMAAVRRVSRVSGEIMGGCLITFSSLMSE